MIVIIKYIPTPGAAHQPRLDLSIHHLRIEHVKQKAILKVVNKII